MNPRRIVKKLVPAGLFGRIAPYGHWAEAVIAQTMHGFPAKKLQVIGVTGTDGKTSTCTLITQMLRSSGYKVAMMTTISVDYGDGLGEQPNATRLTTVGVFDLVKTLKKIRNSGAEWLVLETTSHALAQYRVWGIPYSVVAMTNIGHEHLDYHKTFENYRDAKRRLFKLCNANKKGLRSGLINADDPSAQLFTGDIARPITYGLENGDLRARDVKLTAAGSRFIARYDEQSSVISQQSPVFSLQSSVNQKATGDWRLATSDNSSEYHIQCHLPGSFNVYNTLAAIGVGRVIGLTKQQIEAGIASLKAVEGRMTRVDAGQAFDVIVDYAHTPESFKKIFKEIRPVTKGKLITVFGSAGRRDESKRAAQGEIAGQFCDIVIATEEDDRDIDGHEILQQIAEGAQRAGKTLNHNLLLIHDRRQAIKSAVALAEAGDTILLLGKGHEKSILSNGPKAAELRHLPQDDNDPRRVTKTDYDEVKAATESIKQTTI